MPEIKKITDVILTLPADHDTGTLSYLTPELTGKDENGYETIGLKLGTKFFELKEYKVSTQIPREQKMDIEAIHGFSLDDHIKGILENEINFGIRKDIIDAIKKLGDYSFINSCTKFQKTMNKWFGYVPKIHIKNDMTLLGKIMMYSNLIAAKSRIRAANFIITGHYIGALLESSQYFEHDGLGGHVKDPYLFYRVGKMNNVSLFIDPNMNYNDRSIIIGSSTSMNEEGVFLAERTSEFQTVETITSEGKLVTTAIMKKMMSVFSSENAHNKFFRFEITEKKHNIFKHLLKKWFPNY